MINAQEKEELIRKVGMKKLAEKIKLTRNQKQEISKFVDLKFKPITTQEIGDRLIMKYKEPNAKWFLPLINIFPVLIFISGFYAPAHSGKLFGFIAGPLLFLAMNSFWHFNFTNWSFCSSKKLEEWDDNIPYGALLAVKEAKKKGIKNFTIYYPTKRSHERLMDDPIIVGISKHGIMVEIFAWDDGKIYE